MKRGLCTRSNNIFSAPVFRVYLCENSLTEVTECMSTWPGLRAKASQSDLKEALRLAVLEFCVFGHLRVIKTLQKAVMLFFAVEIDIISFKSIFSFIAIAEKAWRGFFVQTFKPKIFRLA